MNDGKGDRATDPVTAPPGDRVVSPLRRLESRFLRPYRGWLAVALAGMLAQAILLLPIPLLQGRVLDRLVRLSVGSAAIGPGEYAASARLIVLALVGMIACHVVRLVLSWRVGAMMGRISQEVVVVLRSALHEKLMRLPMSYFDGQQTGRLMARVTSDVGSILVFINSGSMQLVNDLILALGIAVLLVWLQWRLALVALVAVPLYAVNHRIFAATMHQLSLDIRAQIASIVREGG
jgi:ABC-type multidrug transport system fused ATPase/permease subunit